jgi:hypothetical protein
MRDNAWAGVLMVAIAVLIAAAFIVLWIRDKGRADEVSDDPERADTGDNLGPTQGRVRRWSRPN